MNELEDIKPITAVKSVLADCLITVINAQFHSSQVVKLTYKTPECKLGNELLLRYSQAITDVAEQERPWNFDSDWVFFRSFSEAYRINLAQMFDHVLAKNSAIINTFPNKINATYDLMLPRQTLRFLFADYTGASKVTTAMRILKLLQGCVFKIARVV